MAFLAPAFAFIGANAGAITAGASLAVGLYGAHKSAKVQKAQGRAEMEAAYDEADQLETRANETLATGSFVSDRIKRKAEQIISTQRAQAAAGGGDTTDQSVQEITAETIRESSLDQLLAMANAESDAAKDRKGAKIARATGRTSDRLARSRASATMIAGTGSLLSGAADWKHRYG